MSYVKDRITALLLSIVLAFSLCPAAALTAFGAELEAAQVPSMGAVAKAAQPMKVSAKAVTMKKATVAKKSKVVKGAIAVTGAQGAVTYAKDANAKSMARFTVAKATGAITVPKGIKAGTYALKVRVSAAGNEAYESGSAVVTVKVRVTDRTSMAVVTRLGTFSYGYNANGFISSSRFFQTKTAYKYSGSRILSAKKSNGDTVKAAYKNGRIVKVTYRFKGYGAIVTDRYAYRNGRVAKVTRANAPNGTVAFAYDKKGRLSKVTEQRSDGTHSTRYAYDSKGNVKKAVKKGPGYTTTQAYKNAYKASKLAKRTLYVNGSRQFTEQVSYKTISVPDKYVAKVRAQQKKLLQTRGEDQDPLFF